jgi:hypothetical protein
LLDFAASRVEFLLVTIFAQFCDLEHEFLLLHALFLTAIRIIGFIWLFITVRRVQVFWLCEHEG